MKYFLTLVALLLLVTPAIADNHKEAADYGGQMPPMGRPAEMDALAFMHGEWTVAMKFKMDPAGEWMETSGTSVVTTELNGCVDRMDFEAMLMGTPFKGFNYSMFNRETGQYDSVWIDDMSAKMSVMSGNFEDGSLVMTGADIQGGMKFHSKSVSKQISDDEVHWNMSMSMDGGETWFENMQMVYTRK